MKKIILILGILLLIGNISAVNFTSDREIDPYPSEVPDAIAKYAPSGGGGTPITIEDNFTKCLKENCDYLCTEDGMDKGWYWKDDKCWCVSYKDTSAGKIVDNDGWIQIEECVLNYDRSKLNIYLKDPFMIFIIGVNIILIVAMISVVRSMIKSGEKRREND